MSSVEVYVYDMSNGLAKSMSQIFLGRQIDGVWHTSIVVFGKEYFFGSTGVDDCPPGEIGLGKLERKIDLGRTDMSYDAFMDHLREISQTTFKGETYHVLSHNCNNFSSELAQFLTGNDIPQDLKDLPEDFLNTPLGAKFRPLIDTIQIKRGHNPFSNIPGQGPPK